MRQNMLDKVKPKNKEQLKQIIKYAFDRGIYDLNFIDTREIRNMSSLFSNIYNDFPYDFDVSGWDVSNVTNMSYMFCGCKNFNCDLSNWKVSNVTDMNSMFVGCVNFTGKGLENWNVSKVEYMNNMFYGCENFNCNLSRWSMANVVNISEMFFNCECFKGEGLENWDLNKMIFLHNIFDGCDMVRLPSWYTVHYKW